MIAEAESVYAWLDKRAQSAVDETVHAYLTALKTGSSEIQVPRMELEVLVNGLLVRNIEFHEELVKRYGIQKNDEDARPEKHLVRTAVVKDAAELAQTAHHTLMRAKLRIAGHSEGEELIYGDGVISGVIDGTIQMRALPLTPTIAAIWVWAEEPAQNHRNGNTSAVRPLNRRQLREFNGVLSRKSDAIAGRRQIDIEKLRTAHARRTKRRQCH